MEGYSVKIREASKELTPKERIKLKDTGLAVKLDEAVTSESTLVIAPEGYVVLDVHNDKSENPDYQQYVIIDKTGKKYITGSPSFWSSFMGIWEEMAGTGEDYEIAIYKMDSKNYKGKQFLTCTIA